MRANLRAAVLTAAAAAALAAAPAAAGADDSGAARSAPPGCEPGSICAYTDYYFGGKMIPLQAGAGCVDLEVPIRSIANTFGSPGIPAAALVYSGPGCTGDVVVNVGQEDSEPVLHPAGVSVFLAW